MRLNVTPSKEVVKKSIEEIIESATFIVEEIKAGPNGSKLKIEQKDIDEHLDKMFGEERIKNYGINLSGHTLTKDKFEVFYKYSHIEVGGTDLVAETLQSYIKSYF